MKIINIINIGGTLEKTPLFEKVSQIVSVTFPAHPSFTYTMVLRPVGRGGLNRTVYVGNCETHDDKDGSTSAVFVVAIFRSDGTLYAASYWQKMADASLAAGKAIASGRIAYGRGHSDKHENFVTYRFGEAQVEGYNPEQP